MTEPLDFRTEEPDDVLDAFARRLAEPLKRAPRADADLADRVMAEIRATQTANEMSHEAAGASWWRQRWQFTVSPLGALGALAAAAAIVFMVRGGSVAKRTTGDTSVARVTAAPIAMQIVQFQLTAAPGSRVSLVGAFNGWNREATQLTPVGDVDALGNQRYVVSVSLPHGRHEYAFVLDDSTWTDDPAASSVRDEFGTRTSVVVVDAPETSNGSARGTSS